MTFYTRVGVVFEKVVRMGVKILLHARPERRGGGGIRIYGYAPMRMYEHAVSVPTGICRGGYGIGCRKTNTTEQTQGTAGTAPARLITPQGVGGRVRTIASAFPMYRKIGRYHGARDKKAMHKRICSPGHTLVQGVIHMRRKPYTMGAVYAHGHTRAVSVPVENIHGGATRRGRG